MAKYVMCNNKKYPFTNDKELKTIEKSLVGKSYKVVDGCFMRVVFNEAAMEAAMQEMRRAVKDNKK